MNCAIDMDFISVSSYGAGAQSTGVVRLIKDLDNNITGRDVVIVEDIIDSGLTMHYLKAAAFREKARVHHDRLLPRQGGPATIRASRPTSAALRFPTNSSSATVSTMPTTTATFRTSAFCVRSATNKSASQSTPLFSAIRHFAA